MDNFRPCVLNRLGDSSAFPSFFPDRNDIKFYLKCRSRVKDFIPTKMYIECAPYLHQKSDNLIIGHFDALAS